MKMLSLLTLILFQTCSFPLLNTKEDIFKNVGNQTVDVTMNKIIWTSTAGINILQYIFFCVQQNSETHTGLEQFEGK